MILNPSNEQAPRLQRRCNWVRLGGMAGVLVSLLAGASLARAQYSGSFLSATNPVSLLPGDSLNITVRVQNTAMFTLWQAISNPSWRTRADQPSWTANWSSLNFDYWSDVGHGAISTMTATLTPDQLPSAPGSYSLRLRTYYNEYDTMTQMSSSPRTVNFSIAAANHAPVVSNITDRTVVESNTLAFTITATDLDTPPQHLTFALNPGFPAGAGVNSTNGGFTWTPPAGYTPATNQISVRVTDDGSPPLSTTNTFKVVVLKVPRFNPPSPPTNGIVMLAWASYPGKTYRLCYKDELGPGLWTNFPSDILATGTLATATNNLGATRQRFYQLQILD